MKIDVQGNSGCIINIVEKDGKNYIHKYTTHSDYGPRLLKQGEKQNKAWLTTSGWVSGPKVKVPYVYSNKTDENGITTIEMDYIYSKNFISFFELSDVTEITKFLANIGEYIDIEVGGSKLTDIDTKILLNKVESVINNAHKNKYVNTEPKFITLLNNILEYIKKFCEKNPTITLPIGMCHGDLTLSNILFTDDCYYLIDFLDSFIDTPLQDICKLRQDTCYKWSTLMFNGTYDKQKVNIIYDYIDKRIDAYFSQYEWYTKYYNILQLINILRIVPYIKKSEVAVYLYNILSQMNYEEV